MRKMARRRERQRRDEAKMLMKDTPMMPLRHTCAIRWCRRGRHYFDADTKPLLRWCRAITYAMRAAASAVPRAAAVRYYFRHIDAQALMTLRRRDATPEICAWWYYLLIFSCHTLSRHIYFSPCRHWCKDDNDDWCRRLCTAPWYMPLMMQNAAAFAARCRRFDVPMCHYCGSAKMMRYYYAARWWCASFAKMIRQPGPRQSATMLRRRAVDADYFRWWRWCRRAPYAAPPITLMPMIIDYVKMLRADAPLRQAKYKYAADATAPFRALLIYYEADDMLMIADAVKWCIYWEDVCDTIRKHYFFCAALLYAAITPMIHDIDATRYIFTTITPQNIATPPPLRRFIKMQKRKAAPCCWHRWCRAAFDAWATHYWGALRHWYAITRVRLYYAFAFHAFRRRAAALRHYATPLPLLMLFRRCCRLRTAMPINNNQFFSSYQ